MAATNFIAGTTVIPSEWCNEVDNLVHTLFNNPDADKIGLAANGDFYVGLAAAPALFLDVSAYDLQIGKNLSTEAASINIGQGRTGNGSSTIDLMGDATYTSYGTRISRGSGVNSTTALFHRGIGAISISAVDAGSIALSTNSIPAVTVDSSQNTGFGISTPDTKVHIWKESAGAVSAFADSIITIENNGNAYLQYLSPNTGIQGSIFGDVDDNNVGGVFYNHSGDTLALRAATVDSLKIDGDATAGNTRLEVYDVNAAALQRLKVGANNTGPGGSGRAAYFDNV